LEIKDPKAKQFTFAFLLQNSIEFFALPPPPPPPPPPPLLQALRVLL
jgi:hypothetical protein